MDHRNCVSRNRSVPWMPPAGALFSPISVAFGSMFQTIQCVNKPRGASGSSTIKTSDFASLGMRR